MTDDSSGYSMRADVTVYKKKTSPLHKGTLFITLIFVMILCVCFTYLTYSSTRHQSTYSKSHATDTPSTNAQSNPATTETPFESRKLTVWSSSFHISIIADLKNFFKELKPRIDITVIDKSLSGSCGLMGTCGDIGMLHLDNAIHTHCPYHLGRTFFDAYKERLKDVDIIICDHNIAICELYMAFNKPMIIYATTRYEHGREDAGRWTKFNENLARFASNPRNVLIANNPYDSKYIEYFTNIKVEVVPNYSGYTNVTYNPSRPEILVTRVKGGNDFLTPIRNILGDKLKLKFIRELYSHYKYEDLAAHPGILLLPYQVSVMSFFEYYRMNIPIFVPDIKFLAKLHKQHQIVWERTWQMIHGNIRDSSLIPKHPNVTSISFDPNDDVHEEAIEYWFQFCDFYHSPHVIQFSSWEHLAELLQSVDYKEISRLMSIHNKKLKVELKRKWTSIFDTVVRNNHNKEMFGNYDEAMRRIYDIDTSNNKCY